LPHTSYALEHDITGTGWTPEEQTFTVLVPIVQHYSDT